MKKYVCLFIVFMTLFAPAFSHKAQKYRYELKTEPLTQKWIKCELAAASELTNADSLKISGYVSALTDFYTELEKSKPDDMVAYYFPESAVIYERLYISFRQLFDMVLNKKIEKSRYDDLRLQIRDGLRDWELLQKNLLSFELNNLYYSYRIFILVIIVLAFISLILLVMYLAASRNSSKVRAFTVQMLHVRETERERIAGQLNDIVCRDLRELQFQLEKKESVNLCKKIAADVRNTANTLIPSDLYEDFFESLNALCSQSSLDGCIKIKLTVNDDIKDNPACNDFSKVKKLNIYRIVQEIINYSIKFSHSREIRLLIRNYDRKHFRITVSDDGNGSDLKASLKIKNNIGLKIIFSRAESLNGVLDLKMSKDRGNQLFLTIPY